MNYPMSETALCAYGSDLNDCGHRACGPPPSPPGTPPRAPEVVFTQCESCVLDSSTNARVQVVRLHGGADGHTAERCSSAEGRRELTSTECNGLSSLIGVSFSTHVGQGADESGCMQWTSLTNTLEFLTNTEEELCVANYCYCGYDQSHPPPSKPPGPPSPPPSPPPVYASCAISERERPACNCEYDGDQNIMCGSTKILRYGAGSDTVCSQTNSNCHVNVYTHYTFTREHYRTHPDLLDRYDLYAGYCCPDGGRFKADNVWQPEPPPPPPPPPPP